MLHVCFHCLFYKDIKEVCGSENILSNTVDLLTYGAKPYPSLFVPHIIEIKVKITFCT